MLSCPDFASPQPLPPPCCSCPGEEAQAVTLLCAFPLGSRYTVARATRQEADFALSAEMHPLGGFLKDQVLKALD